MGRALTFQPKMETWRFHFPLLRAGRLPFAGIKGQHHSTRGLNPGTVHIPSGRRRLPLLRVCTRRFEETTERATTCRPEGSLMTNERTRGGASRFHSEALGPAPLRPVVSQ